MSHPSAHSIYNEDLVYSQGASRYLVPYACIAEQSKGRQFNENESLTRSPYQRDRDRIIHSAAFRRLEYKTQVFVFHEGDHYRTRLTHSLEVAQLSRSIARELHLDEDLSEAIALAHDLGHTPFGHAGEDALAEVMQPYGGFDHNAQTLRILMHLEQKYALFNGLNLSWECLEAIAKHNGPVKGVLPRALQECNEAFDLGLDSFTNLEGQVAAFCDDIAYNNHDIEDGLRAGLLSLEEVMELPLIGPVFKAVKEIHKDVPRDCLIHEAKRRIINDMVNDIVQQARIRIADARVKTVEDIRHLDYPLIAFSQEVEHAVREVKQFLRTNMYDHYKVNRMTTKMKRVLQELFEFFMKHPDCLPGEWRDQAENSEDTQAYAVTIADFIAGMTDRYAIEEHQKVFDPKYKLIGG